MKMKKGMKLYTKLVCMVCFSQLTTVFLMYCGYGTATSLLDAEDPEKYVRSYSIFCLIMLIFLSVVFFILVSNFQIRFKKGFDMSARIIQEMVEGKTDIVIEDDYKDEFANLFEGYKALLAASKQQAEYAAEVAKGNLTVEVKPRSDQDTLGIALKEMVANNKYSLSNISQAAQQVLVGSTQVSGASDAMAQGATEQASAIEEISASMNSIGERTRQNASEAEKAAELIKLTLDDVHEGNAKMEEMVDAMNEISESSENISRIIKVIDDIAFQTNILALNAAVEAVRAGKAGNGFAVVAEEIRELANKSAQAAAETSKLIENSIDKVHTGSKMARLTSKSFEDITNHVTQSEALIRDISESSRVQAESVEQINEGINQVSEVVQSNSATSQECAASSIELSHQATQMKELVNIYILE